jgi:hypothetical protein
MAMTGDIKSYMQQWLQTATKGDVVVDYAWFQDRMELRCKKCHAVFRCTLPESPTEIDWSIQKWVKQHAPGGEHDTKELHCPVDPIPLTADFHKLPSFNPIPLQTGGQTGIIDASEAKAAILKAQMETYKAEQEKKDIDGKVEWLKKTAAQKAEVAAAQTEKAKEQALANLLLMMTQMTQNPQIVKAMKPPEAVLPKEWETTVTPQPRIPKAAKIVTGRRFR